MMSMQLKKKKKGKEHTHTHKKTERQILYPPPTNLALTNYAANNALH